MVHGARRAGANDVREGSWIRRESVQYGSIVDRFPERLDPGEREALALAREIGAALLVDEVEARREASRLWIPYLCSLRVLREAKSRGIIPEVKPVLDDLIAAGMYVSDTLYGDFLREMGE